MSLNFEWDDGKAASNLTKHRVSFSVAARTFYDPHRLEREFGPVDRKQNLHRHRHSPACDPQPQHTASAPPPGASFRLPEAQACVGRGEEKRQAKNSED